MTIYNGKDMKENVPRRSKNYNCELMLCVFWSSASFSCFKEDMCYMHKHKCDRTVKVMKVN